MKHLLNLTIAICYLLPSPTYSQTESIDSLKSLLSENLHDTTRIKTLNELARNTYRTEPTQGLEYAKDAIELASKVGGQKLMSFALFYQSKSYVRLSKYDSAMLSLSSAETLARSTDQQRLLLDIINEQAYVNNINGNMEEAFEKCFYLIRVLDSIKMYPDIKIRTLGDIGELYRSQEDGANAIKYYDLARELAKENNNKRGMLRSDGNTILALKQLGKYEEALELSLKLEEDYLEFFDEDDISRVYSNRGNILMDMERWDDAERELLKAWEIRKNLDFPRSKAYTLKELAYLYNTTNQPRKSVFYNEQAYLIAKELDFPFLMRDITGTLADALHKLGDYKRAYVILKEQRVYRDQLMDLERLELSQEMEKKYEAEKREQQIALQNEKLLTQEARLESAATQRNALISGSFLILIIGGLVINRQKLSIKNKAKEKELTELKLAKAKDELELREQELLTYVISIAQKNNLLHNVKEEAQRTDDLTEANKRLRRINHDIENGYNLNQQWEEFRQRFEKIHQSFFDKLAEIASDLTNTDRRICAYLKLGLSSKQIANLQNVGVESVEVRRSQIRRKLGLTKEDSLSTFIMNIH